MVTRLEALGHLVDALFRQQTAHRVIAMTDARNEAAARLFRRPGFRHEGRVTTGAGLPTPRWASARRVEHCACRRRLTVGGSPRA
ncbi:GNAT family protein [Curtobacterium sp. DN_7.5]|uniref:GNAT family N-acetyltransferase n=1 Tax=Curtobacterium sp. DN_7.5 TaxID=3049047 RepID=UPI001F575022|nr:GNAT family protein [Curtobacterium sp. DN_7.5]